MTPSTGRKKIESAFFSLSNKDRAIRVARRLHEHGVTLHATRNTARHFCAHSIPTKDVEAITGYPPLLDGRLKTLHPTIFGGILYRRHNAQDVQEVTKHALLAIDLVVVDLYPFAAAVEAQSPQEAVIEAIDVGGISLLRAAAKNYRDVAVIGSCGQYEELLRLLNEQAGCLTLADRQRFATQAFLSSAAYDSDIWAFFQQATSGASKEQQMKKLRHGENPHQEGFFHGRMDHVLHQHQGKALSYVNLLDVDAALRLLHEFTTSPACVIVKHATPCGVGVGSSGREALTRARTVDAMSAFGGVFAVNCEVEASMARFMGDLFYEVLVATSYTEEALNILCAQKNRIILTHKNNDWQQANIIRSALNGRLIQTSDDHGEDPANWQSVTKQQPSEAERHDLLLAYRVVKHAKSNSIVLAKAGKILGIGSGQPSRIDALQMALHKAQQASRQLQGMSMASEAFFPFSDCVEMAHKQGVVAVVQPGGSVNDALSVDYCNRHGLRMMLTQKRHFKH